MSRHSAYTKGKAVDVDGICCQDEFRIKPRLTSLPTEIVELIAFHCANGSSSLHIDSPMEHIESFATPPSNLLSLIRTNRRMYSLLSPMFNPRLYARIFRSKFDVDAIARRFGHSAVSPRNLTIELQKRCICLKRIRRAVSIKRLFPTGESEQSRQEMEENLWVAFMMMMENDGLNILQLQWARIESYLHLHHSQDMLASALRPEYPPDTPDRALALHINYLFSNSDKILSESRDESDEKLFVLRPFVFAAHRFDAFFAPWTARILPVQKGEDGLESEEEMGINPFVADLRLRSRYRVIQHCGQKITISPPNTTHAACFSFFMKVETDPAVTVFNVNDPVYIAEAMMGRRRGSSSSEEQMSTRSPLSYTSQDHDQDMQRLLSCTSPQSSPGLTTAFHLGMLEGSWEGRFTYFDFDSYRDMLGGKLRSLYEGQFGEQPQVWKIKEHVVKLGKNELPGGSGEILNSGYQGENDEPTSRETMSVREARKSLALNQSLPHDSHLYPTFEEGNDQMEVRMDMDDEQQQQRRPEDQYEILLSGTGHSAWGSFILRGRVRSWDGMVIMTKEYRPNNRGRWLYRGYVVAGARMVGRWRDTFTPEAMSGYEGYVYC